MISQSNIINEQMEKDGVLLKSEFQSFLRQSFVNSKPNNGKADQIMEKKSK